MNTYYISEMLDDMIKHVQGGATVHLQWECPKCHDKITADDPIKLVWHNGEHKVALYKSYRHSERDNGEICDTLVSLEAKAFNYLVMLTIG